MIHRFYTDPQNISTDSLTLDFDETHHLKNVLRLKESDLIRVFDGQGREFLCRINRIGKERAIAKIVEEIPPAARESSLDLHLAIGLLKGEKFDLVVQKAVELGVKMLTPLITKRSDVKISNLKDRWKKIIIQASKQCGRANLMKMYDPMPFGIFLNSHKGKNLIVFSEQDGTHFSAIKSSQEIIAVIGPEGGWDGEEIDLARSHGALVVTLNGRVMRAETSTIAITAILQHRFGDLT